MENKRKIIDKGYTIFCTSWENDGDNYNTLKYTVETKEEALLINKICKELFISRSHNYCGIGNTTDEEIFDKGIKSYIKDNPELTYDYIFNINKKLLGKSEYYYSRVYESSYIVYSPEDIYLEEIIY